ncbi:MAG: hypothetical protein ACR2LC_10815 [Pyrinomonadaceae bacterium]
MFHLLVKDGNWAQGKDSLPRGRVFEYTDDAIIKQFESDGTLNADLLISLPALLVSETNGKGEPKARVGSIIRAQVLGNKVNIEYSFDEAIPPIANSTLEKLSTELNIESFEFFRTHWAIKNVDLFQILVRNQVAALPSPKVFKLDKNEEVDSNLLSAMMPFDLRFNDVYSTIKAAAKESNMQCLRADDIWQSDAIIQDVVSLINKSRIIVCDFTNRNANVFYEAGIAHTLGRDVIMITQLDSDIPFDLRHLRYIPYLNNGEGREKLRERLRQRIQTLLESSP